MLLMIWFDEPFRGMRDLDLLGYGDPSPERLVGVFKEASAMDAQDGGGVDADSVRISRIREDNQSCAAMLWD